MKEPVQQIWIRVAVQLQVTESEMDTLVQGSELETRRTLGHIFSSGRAEWGHDCYIPCDVIDLYNEQTGKAYEADDVTISADSLEGMKIKILAGKNRELGKSCR